MRPRLSGRSWQTDMVIPENGCIFRPGLSALRGWKWNWISGVDNSGRVLQKMHTWLAPIAIGPRRVRM